MPVTLTHDAFKREIGELYARLYDLIYLRGHPLADALVPDVPVGSKERGWRLHDLLLEVIEELDPGPEAPAFSREWRRYRLMVERYRNALEPGAVMQIIAVSRRQYYREHEAAIEAIAGLLWERYMIHRVPAGRAVADSAAEPAPDRIALLRLEAARLAQAGRYTDAADVVRRVVGLLDERLRQRSLTLQAALPAALPPVAVEKGLLRQMLLGVLGYLAERASDAAICLEAEIAEDAVHLTLLVQPPEACRPTPAGEVSERLAAFSEMATLAQASLETVTFEDVVVGFDLGLPRDTQPLILVVDDNEDVLELVRRLLTPHGYRLATATTAEQALSLAAQLQPYAVILDLMLPGQDGWDLLQLLLNRPDTRMIPVIICSVLKQRELALSLGAVAFLEKPVTEHRLLEVLHALRAG
jgi:CheY-like chemotaxis protein/Arc/MetJ-type ribon-helix-helix transcriptional regulator